jgi:hypothetical protein
MGSDLSSRNYFAGQAMMMLMSQDGWSFSQVARDAYMLADEMLRQENAEKEDEDGEWTVMFIGGPRHGETIRMESVPVVECESGQYHRHFLGLEHDIFKMVYIWSELSAEDVVDLVINSIKQSPAPSDEGVVTLGVDGSKARLNLDDGIRSMSVTLTKEAVGLLAEGLAVCFSELKG